MMSGERLGLLDSCLLYFYRDTWVVMNNTSMKLYQQLLSPNLIKIQLFIIPPFYRTKIWQRPVGGHMLMTLIFNQSNLCLPDSDIVKLSKLVVWSILIGWWNSPRWKLQKSSAHDLLWDSVRSSYDSRAIV